MKERLEQIFESFKSRIGNVESMNELTDIRVKYLGKNGEITDLLKGLKNKGLPRKEYDLFFQLKEYGNKAAHPGKIKKEPPYKYDDSELIDILECFNKTLFILDKYAEKKLRLA